MLEIRKVYDADGIGSDFDRWQRRYRYFMVLHVGAARDLLGHLGHHACNGAVENDAAFKIFGQSLRARARLNGNLELSRRIISFVTHDEQKSLRCMRSYGCVRVSLPLRPDDRVGHAATFPVFGGWF